jgi:hypothetical protein
MLRFQHKTQAMQKNLVKTFQLCPLRYRPCQYQVTLFLTSQSKSHQHKRTPLDSDQTHGCVIKRTTSSVKVYSRTLEEDDHSEEVDKDEKKCDEEVDEDDA